METEHTSTPKFPDVWNPAVILHRIAGKLAEDGCYCTDDQFCEEHRALNGARRAVNAHEEFVSFLQTAAHRCRTFGLGIGYADRKVTVSDYKQVLLDLAEGMQSLLAKAEGKE